MSKKLMRVGVVSVVVLASVPALASVLINVDFNSDKAGGNPTASYRNEPADTDIRIVDSGSIPADPFGGADNRSLLAVDTGVLAPSAGWATEGFLKETKAMTLSLKTYIANDASCASPYVIIQAGKNDLKNSSLTALESAVQLTILSNKLYARSGAAMLQLDQLPGVDLNFNSTWDVVISISPDKRTWSATINGIRLTKGRGAVSTFDFRDNASVDGVNFVSLEGQSANAGSRIFLDDIKLESAPE